MLRYDRAGEGAAPLMGPGVTAPASSLFQPPGRDLIVPVSPRLSRPPRRGWMLAPRAAQFGT